MFSFSFCPYEYYFILSLINHDDFLGLMFRSGESISSVVRLKFGWHEVKILHHEDSHLQHTYQYRLVHSKYPFPLAFDDYHKWNHIASSFLMNSSWTIELMDVTSLPYKWSYKPSSTQMDYVWSITMVWIFSCRGISVNLDFSFQVYFLCFVSIRERRWVGVMQFADK